MMTCLTALPLLFNSNNAIIQQDISKKIDIVQEKYIEKKVIKHSNKLISKPAESTIIDNHIENEKVALEKKEQEEKRIKNEVKNNNKRIKKIKDEKEKKEEEKAKEEEKKRKEKERKEREQREEKERKAQIERIKDIKINLKSRKIIPIKVQVTGYCNCKICSGKYGNSTSSGRKTHLGTIAVPQCKEIPFGTKIYIPGYNRIFVAEDYGGGIEKRGDRFDIDIWQPTHKEAEAIGRSNKIAYIIK